MRDRLVTIFWFGFIVGLAVMLKDVPPTSPEPTTWWDVIQIIIFVAFSIYLGFKSGIEQSQGETLTKGE